MIMLIMIYAQGHEETWGLEEENHGPSKTMLSVDESGYSCLAGHGSGDGEACSG